MDSQEFESELEWLLRRRAEHAVELFAAGDMADEVIRNAVQRRGPLMRVRRFLNMTTRNPRRTGYGLVAALAVGGLIMLGINLWSGGNTGSPQESPSPTPADSAGAPVNAGQGGDDSLLPGKLRSGRYSLRDTFPVRISFDHVDGWIAYLEATDVVGTWHPGRVGPNGVSTPTAYVVYSAVAAPQADPCDPAAGELAAVTSPAALAAALGDLPGFTATEPQAVDLAGLSATVIELTPTYDPAACESVTPSMWLTPSGGFFQPTDLGGEDRPTLRIHILDVNDSLLAITTVNVAKTDGEDAHLADILASLAIEPE